MRSKIILVSIAIFCSLWIISCSGGGSSSDKFNPPESSYQESYFDFTNNNAELRVKGASVTLVFFQAAGVSPLLGRVFVKDEYAHNARKVAVISRDFWIKHFSSDPAVIGKPFGLNGADYTVIGVMPDYVNIPQGAQIWIPKEG